MGVPTGAVAMIRPTVQASKVAWTGSQEWPLNLLAVCDMTTVPAINPDAASFVAALDANLADLRMTNVADTLIPWRRAENALFSQTPGAEKLYVRVKADLSGDANTEYRGYRGSSGAGGEDTGANVVGANTTIFSPMADVEPVTNWAGANLTTRSSDPSGATGYLGNAVYLDGNDTLSAGTHATASGFTFAVMVNATTIYRHQILSQWGLTGAGNASWWFGGYDRQIRYEVYDGTTGYNANTGDWRDYDGEWHLVVGTYHPTAGIEWWMDGVSMASNASARAQTSTIYALTIGAEARNLALPHTGTLDELLFCVGNAWGAEEAVSYANMTLAPATWCVCGAEEALATGRSRPFSQMRCGPRLVIGGVI